MALVALQGQFLWKRTTFLDMVCNTLGTDIGLFLVSGTYMLCVRDFGGMWKEETNPSCGERVAFPFFPARSAVTRSTEEAGYLHGGNAQRLTLTAERTAEVRVG